MGHYLQHPDGRELEFNSEADMQTAIGLGNPFESMFTGESYQVATYVPYGGSLKGIFKPTTEQEAQKLWKEKGIYWDTTRKEYMTEVDDSKALTKFKDGLKPGVYKFAEVIDHPSLLKALPDLAKVQVVIGKGGIEFDQQGKIGGATGGRRSDKDGEYARFRLGIKIGRDLLGQFPDLDLSKDTIYIDKKNLDEMEEFDLFRVIIHEGQHSEQLINRTPEQEIKGGFDIENQAYSTDSRRFLTYEQRRTTYPTVLGWEGI